MEEENTERVDWKRDKSEEDESSRFVTTEILNVRGMERKELPTQFTTVMSFSLQHLFSSNLKREWQIKKTRNLISI